MKLRYLFLFVCHFSLFTFHFSLSSEEQKAKSHKPLSHDEAKVMSKDAAGMFNSGDYNSALKGYTELIKTAPTNPEYNYRLGVSLLMTNSNKTKAYEYLETASKGKDVKKEVWYYLGMSYMHASLWDEAVQAFNTFKTIPNLKPNKDFLPPDRMIEMVKNAKELIVNPVKVKFENMGKLINTSYEDYNPYISADGKLLVYSSRRKGNLGGFMPDQGTFTADILSSQWRDTVGWSKGKGLGTFVNTDWDEESVSLTADGNQLFISFDNENAFGDLGISSNKGRSWAAPTMVSDIINDPNSVENSGCLSNDGRILYFSSDRNPGQGGFDIWYSIKESSGGWGLPQTIGNVVNTKYDEISPFISLDGRTLFFSSKGHNSMGGYDIFSSNYDSSSGKWSKPVNMGYPVNTVDDEVSFSVTGNGQTVYIGAVRPEGLGDKDIYKLTFDDTTGHPFRIVISGIVSGSTAGKIELRNATLTGKSDKKVVAFYSPYYMSNKYVLAATPGTYILKVDGYGFQPIQEEITVTDAFPPTDIIKNFVVDLAK